MKAIGRRITGFANNQNTVGYLFITPNLLVYLSFVLIPMFTAIVFSFSDFNIMFTRYEFAGFDNYAKAFGDWRFWNALKNTAYYTVLIMLIQPLFSLFVAMQIKQATKINALFRTFFFMPVICSMAIISLLFKFLLNADVGAISYYLAKIGIHWKLLSDPKQALTIIVLVAVWKGFGYGMVIFLAALQGVPEVYYEAAAIDGVNRWQRFIHITIPMIMPTISFIMVTGIIGSFQVFDQAYMMTEGGPVYSTETLVYYIYKLGFKELKMGYAAAIALILFVIIATISLLTFNRTSQSNTD